MRCQSSLVGDFMVDYNDFNNPICHSQFGWLEDQWKAFTAMTEEEEENWRRYLIFNLKKKAKNEKRVLCIETNEIFDSIKDLAMIINKTPKTIQNYIKDNKSVYGKHYRYL